MSKKISVILNGFRRPHRLQEQVEAIRNQSVPVEEILYWQNTDPDMDYNQSLIDTISSARSSRNWGVWSRFAYALNVKSDYVCIFDDDTIPGSQWIENCLETYEHFPGLLGTSGLIFTNGDYRHFTRFGWYQTHNEFPVQVDIVGHAWFFSRDLLSIFWRELPSLDQDMCVGEDIHFSHMIQKYTPYKTYVPAHPASHPQLWGSLKGMDYGTDSVATYLHAMPLMGEYLNRSTANGFQLIRGGTKHDE